MYSAGMALKYIPEKAHGKIVHIDATEVIEGNAENVNGILWG